MEHEVRYSWLPVDLVVMVGGRNDVMCYCWVAPSRLRAPSASQAGQSEAYHLSVNRSTDDKHSRTEKHSPHSTTQIVQISWTTLLHFYCKLHSGNILTEIFNI